MGSLTQSTALHADWHKGRERKDNYRGGRGEGVQLQHASFLEGQTEEVLHLGQAGIQAEAASPGEGSDFRWALVI